MTDSTKKHLSHNTNPQNTARNCRAKCQTCTNTACDCYGCRCCCAVACPNGAPAPSQHVPFRSQCLDIAKSVGKTITLTALATATSMIVTHAVKKILK